MIYAGLSHTLPGFVELYRLLKAHPDVEVKWIHNYNRVQRLDDQYPALKGEIAGTTVERPDFESINLYVGPTGNPELRAALTERPELRIIAVDEADQAAGQLGCEVYPGVAEFSRKALVRGARVASLPTTATMLGALALMPPAKNLMLNGAVSGAVMLPAEFSRPGPVPGPYPSGEWAELRHAILERLQTSFNSPLDVLAFNVEGPVAMGTFSWDLRLSRADLLGIYHNFYDDHRHVVIIDDATEPTADMVRGTHKAVICPREADGRVYVSVLFDADWRTGHGAVVHLMNLLFGLDERTGLCP